MTTGTASGGQPSNWHRCHWGAIAIWVLMATVALPAIAQGSKVPLDFAITPEDKLAQALMCSGDLGGC